MFDIVCAMSRVLVWNDVGVGAIMRAHADGTGRTQLAGAPNATALALDQPSATVYWALARQIHAVNLDGNNKSDYLLTFLPF